MRAVAMAWPASQSPNQLAPCLMTLWTAEVFSSERVLEPRRTSVECNVAETMLTIHGGTVVTMNARREVFAPGSVVVGEDGSIESVGPASPPEGRVLDASGKIVLPGFVQTHVHLCQTLYRSRADDKALLEWLKERIWPYEAALDETALRANARLGIAELLRNGTT